MPAQALDVPRPLGDEILAMVDEQAELALGAVERRDRQVGLAEDRLGDGIRIDRVALAGLAHRAADTGHELGRHPDDRFARPEEVDFQAAGEVAAVLERPAALRETGRPAAELEMPVRIRPDRLLAEPAAGLAHRHDRVPALVQIRSQDDHVRVSSSLEVTEDRSVDTAELGRSHAPIKSRRPVCRVSGPAQAMEATPWGRATMVRAKPGDAAEGDTQPMVPVRVAVDVRKP